MMVIKISLQTLAKVMELQEPLVTPDGARERIIKAEARLRRDHYVYLANAFKRYLDGNAKSLDEAFGLTRRPTRGAPKRNAQRDIELSRKILEWRIAGESWPAVCDKLSSEGFEVTDERTIRKIYEGLFIEVIAEKVLARSKGGA